MTDLSDMWAEWRPGADGLLERDAARVVVFDGAGRVLLQKGHDYGKPDRQWWFTPGGGLAPGEDARTGAARELREETGIVVAPADLEGPVAHRIAIFDFDERNVRQREEFFLLRLADTTELDTSGWTPWERDLVDGQEWVPVHAVKDLPETIYPSDLPALVEDLAGGWDGVARRLDDYDQ